jgi:hypothetical protein
MLNKYGALTRKLALVAASSALAFFESTAGLGGACTTLATTGAASATAVDAIRATRRVRGALVAAALAVAAAVLLRRRGTTTHQLIDER